MGRCLGQRLSSIPSPDTYADNVSPSATPGSTPWNEMNPHRYTGTHTHTAPWRVSGCVWKTIVSQTDIGLMIKNNSRRRSLKKKEEKRSTSDLFWCLVSKSKHNQLHSVIFMQIKAHSLLFYGLLQEEHCGLWNCRNYHDAKLFILSVKLVFLWLILLNVRVKGKVKQGEYTNLTPALWYD